MGKTKCYDRGRKDPRPVATFNLRMDRDLYDTLSAEAKDAYRSLSAQIHWRLRQSLRKADTAAAA